MSKNIFIRRFFAGIFAVFICSALFGLAQARIVESVSILMAAPFADATQNLVKQFNKEYRGKINLKVIRGPLETEAMSDLAISSLLLGKAPFDVLLMDVTWLPKYAAAGWMVPLENNFNTQDVVHRFVCAFNCSRFCVFRFWEGGLWRKGEAGSQQRCY